MCLISAMQTTLPLLAYTPADLQRLVDAAAECCEQTGMVISAGKTKVLVFSHCFPGPHQWHCAGAPLEWVPQFRYLGTVFDSRYGIDSTYGSLHQKMWGAWAQLRRRYGKLQCSMSVGLLLQLYDACVPPTASYGCEVWGLRALPAGDRRKARAPLGSAHFRILREIPAVPTSVHQAILLRDLDQRPLAHAWWQRVVKFWNTMAALPAGSLYRQVVLDDCRDAITANVKNWAWAFIRGLRDLGYEFTIRCDTLVPLDFAAVLQLLDARAGQVWHGIDVCPRTCPSQGATLCTYERWFARPQGLHRPGPLLQQPLSARCLRAFMRFRMGAQSLPNVLGRRHGSARALRHCSHCDMHALGDERHMLFECPALQPVRDRYAALFGPSIVTVRQFIWQLDVVAVAHFVMDCFDLLHSPDDDVLDDSSNQP